MLNLFFTVLFLIGALLSAWGLWLARGGFAQNYYIDSREADATHLLMNATMAIMLTSLYTSDTVRVITVLYWLGAGTLAVRTFLLFRQTVTRKTAGEQAHIGGTIYHLFMLFTMLYALRLMPPETGQSMTAMPGMATMSNVAPMPSTAPSWTAIALGIIFLLDAVSSFVVVVFFPQSLQKAQAALVKPRNYIEPQLASAYTSIRLLRLSLVPHLLMDIGMAYMLLSV